MQQHLWPDQFIERFLTEFWEQKPGVFNYPAANYLATLDELFQAVLAMPARGSSDRFWVAKSKSPAVLSDFRVLHGQQIDLFGPRLSDNNLAGFFDRMKQHTFGMNIHSLGLGLAEIDQRMHSIVRHFDLSKVTATSSSVAGWMSDTFFGTYRTTPFGIHRDPASVMALCLLGHRTYYTWPESYFDAEHQDLHTPNLAAIERHVSNAEIFEVSPGQLFYWPSNRWHVATSNGEPSAVVQISAYLNSAQPS